MLLFPHVLPHRGRDHRSRSAHRRSALPDAANIEVMKVKAAKYFSKFDYCHGRAWAKAREDLFPLQIACPHAGEVCRARRDN